MPRENVTSVWCITVTMMQEQSETGRLRWPPIRTQTGQSLWN